MTAIESQPNVLSGDQLVEMLGLVREADSVELKLTIPEAEQRSALRALEVDPLDAQIRQVFFFDTPDLALNAKGIVVRARRVQNKGEDAIIKLRPVVPHELPAGLRGSPAFNVEVDAMPGGFVCSATLKSAVKEGCIVEHIHGDRPLRKLFSKEQRAFFAERAPSGITFEDLVILGPVFVLKLKYSPAGLSRRLVTEMWLYPDGSRILELSIRTGITDAFEGAAEVRAFLTERGVGTGGEQQTKTRTALEFYARELAGTPPVAPVPAA